MTNGAGHMRLDERAWDAAWKVWLDCADVQKMDRDSALKHAITAYLAAIVPGDVQKLIERLNERHRAYMALEPGPQMSASVVDGLDAASALLTLSAENAELKARLDGTVGVEILEK